MAGENRTSSTVKVHRTAELSPRAAIGKGTTLWNECQVREGAKVGKNCILGKSVYIDAGVSIGDNVKIQNYVSVYHGVTIEDGVFVGPHACFTNDLRPRAVTPSGALRRGADWKLSKTLVREGASLGANCTIRCGVTIGRWAMVGAGSMVTHDVPDYGLVYGTRARLRGFVCPCGHVLKKTRSDKNQVVMVCVSCGGTHKIPRQTWRMIGRTLK